MTLSGRIALVTGAAGGIGRAAATVLAASGAAVAVTDLDGPGAHDVAEQLSSAGYSAAGLHLDVTSPESIDHARRAVEDRYGRIDILVNNAGFPVDRPLEEMGDADWNRVLEVCLYGAFACSRAMIPGMAAQGHGRVINVSSRAYLGNPGQANYSSAKAGLVGLTRSLAKEFGRHGVTVNAVAPGMIETAAVKAHPKWETIARRAVRESPIRRLGSVQDVAHAIAFFAADTTSYITGEVIHVSGGRRG